MRQTPFIALLALTLLYAAPAAPQDAPDEPPLVPEPTEEAPLVPAEPEGTPAEIPAPGVHPLTRADLAAWLDGFMPYALADGGVAGAVVVVVADGDVALAKGYGYSDLESHAPVDPAHTLFRPGSISKLFTWTAVMQLVEQGQIDLDADVGEYLDFDLPERDGDRPITMRDIMTHTAGFEERLKKLITPDPENAEPLGESMASWVPRRIFPAGSTPAYSNYATGLAGYIVERVSGQSFDDYIDEHIFAPLGMHESTFRQPLPERLVDQMSKGYADTSGEAQPFEIVNPAPAGSLSSTGTDMAKFMLAHLNGGELSGVRILQPETARTMHETMLTMLPPLNRMALGFYETDVNGRDVIAHGGDTQWFHSYLHLFLDEGIGLYVAVNSAGKRGAAHSIRTALFEQFADRYLPGPEPSGEVDPKTAAEHAALMAGTYTNSRRPETTFLASLNLFGQAKVVDNGDGTITVPAFTDLSGAPKVWREISPYVWVEDGGDERLAAVLKDGVVQRFSMDAFSPFMVFEPVPWWKSSAWLLPLLNASLAALALTALLWPVKAVVRRRYAQPPLLTGPDLRAYRWGKIASWAVLVVLAGWALMVTAMFSDLSLLAGVFDPLILLLQLLSIVVFPVGFAIALWHAANVWRGQRRWPAKAWSIVLVVAFATVLWVALAFNLIGFGTDY